ncbi:GspE/PulE family protein [Magnetococcales bacterium HHB-1]
MNPFDMGIYSRLVGQHQSAHKISRFFVHPDLLFNQLREEEELFQDGKLASAYNPFLDANVLQLDDSDLPSVEAFYNKSSQDTDSDVSEQENKIKKIISSILLDAFAESATDVHIEPVEGKTRIRFRVDGVLITHKTWDHQSIQARLSSFIKLRANLNLAETRRFQDGSFLVREKQNRKTIDIRVSVLPTTSGEKIVLRLQNHTLFDQPLEELGISKGMLKEMIYPMLSAKEGLVILSGPTGSGKTTTLYSFLKNIERQSSKNIITVENPVEIHFKDLFQVDVNDKIDRSFNDALRAILRQDPDVVMVGEIRDKEAARMTVQAARTGHLVLSTLHTDSALGIIPRLLSFGVDRIDLADVLTLAIAQRLVRKPCTVCSDHKTKKKDLIAEVRSGFRGALKERINEIVDIIINNSERNISYYKPNESKWNHCPHCHEGYKGRRAIFEIITPSRDKKIRQEILKETQDSNFEHDTYHDIHSSDYENTRRGKQLLDHAIEAMITGETTVEEIYEIFGTKSGTKI